MIRMVTTMKVRRVLDKLEKGCQPSAWLQKESLMLSVEAGGWHGKSEIWRPQPSAVNTGRSPWLWPEGKRGKIN